MRTEGWGVGEEGRGGEGGAGDWSGVGGRGTGHDDRTEGCSEVQRTAGRLVEVVGRGGCGRGVEARRDEGSRVAVGREVGGGVCGG